MPTLFGVELPELEEDFGSPLSVLVIVKCLKNEDDPTIGDGKYRLVTRSSDIPTWEVYGMAAWVQHVAFEPGDGES